MGKSKFPPKAETARIGPFKSNKQFWVEHSFAKNSAIFSHFCWFRHQNKLVFNFIILGKFRFPPKKVYDIAHRRSSFLFRCQFLMSRERKREKERKRESNKLLFISISFFAKSIYKKTKTKQKATSTGRNVKTPYYDLTRFSKCHQQMQILV